MDAQPNLGSTGMGQGQDALQAAIAMRQSGGNVPQLNQTMQGSPQPIPPQEGIPSMTQPGSAGKAPSSESELIIKALSQRLGSISKLESGQQNVGGGGYGMSAKGSNERGC